MPCRNHPQVESGLAVCAGCGLEFCEECRVEFQGRPHCAPCKAKAVVEMESGQRSSAGGGDLPAWERRQEMGITAAFWETVKAAMLDPARFFSRLDTRVTSWDCLAIPCILSVLGAIVSAIMQIAFAGLFAGLMGMSGEMQGDEAMMFGGMQLFSGTFGACLGVVLAPVAAIVMAFVIGGLIHLWLMMTSNVGVPYQQTVRGWCYAQAPNILGVIPILGGLVAFFWVIWTQVVMVKEVHKTSWGTAWVSVLWYYVLFCVVCGGLYAAMIAAIVAANQGG